MANNNNNQKYQLKIDKQRWIIPVKFHENSLMVDTFARLATETCFHFVQVQACNGNVFYSYLMSILLIGHTLLRMRDKRSWFRNKVGYLNGEEKRECTTTQHFFTTNLDTINWLHGATWALTFMATGMKGIADSTCPISIQYNIQNNKVLR